MKVRKEVFGMKRYTFVEKRIYFAEIEYDCHLYTASEVARAYAVKYPESGKFSHEYDLISKNVGVCRLYREKVFDFIEK